MDEVRNVRSIFRRSSSAGGRRGSGESSLVRTGLRCAALDDWVDCQRLPVEYRKYDLTETPNSYMKSCLPPDIPAGQWQALPATRPMTVCGAEIATSGKQLPLLYPRAIADAVFLVPRGCVTRVKS